MTAENKDAKRPTRGLGAARSQQSHETASRARVRGAQPRSGAGRSARKQQTLTTHLINQPTTPTVRHIQRGFACNKIRGLFLRLCVMVTAIR